MVADNSKLIKEVDLPLDKDDVVILYTDGIIEARNMMGEMYGLERFKKAVELYAPQYGSEGIVHHVAREFSFFVQEHVQEDDVTMIAIRYMGPDVKPELATVQKKSTTWMDPAAAGVVEPPKKALEHGVLVAIPPATPATPAKDSDVTI